MMMQYRSGPRNGFRSFLSIRLACRERKLHFLHKCARIVWVSLLVFPKPCKSIVYVYTLYIDNIDSAYSTR